MRNAGVFDNWVNNVMTWGASTTVDDRRNTNNAWVANGVLGLAGHPGLLSQQRLRILPRGRNLRNKEMAQQNFQIHRGAISVSR
jgi:hypothetical protein